MDLSRVIEASALDPAAYAIGGAPPGLALRPATREALAECLRAAASERLSVMPWGGGTTAPRAAVPERYDLALDLSGLDRIIEYNPEDMTLTAECGVTIGTLRATLAARGQELPLERAHADRATLGGTLALNASGPRRLRFGAPRDRLLGARFALADGTLARTGGKVVKNVTGFGIHRLLCGSRGGLGVLVEASLKLMPAPETRLALVYHVGAKALGDAACWATLPRLEPAAVTLLGQPVAAAIPLIPAGPAWTLVIVLEDDALWVATQTRRLEEALGPPAARIESGQVPALEQALCDGPERWARGLTFTSAWNSPAAIGVPFDDAATSELVYHCLAGRLYLEPDIELPATKVHRLAGSGFTLVESRGVEPVEPALPPLAAIGCLRSRIRQALDPLGLWANGPAWEIRP